MLHQFHTHLQVLVTVHLRNTDAVFKYESCNKSTSCCQVALEEWPWAGIDLMLFVLQREQVCGMSLYWGTVPAAMQWRIESCGECCQNRS